MSYPQLLSLIGGYDLKNLSQLGETGVFELTENLNEIWYDSYDYDKTTTDDMSDQMDKFISNAEKLIETTNVKKKYG